MPTLLIEAGFHFRIYTRDHPPAHVHVIRQGEKVVIEFETEIVVRDNSGIRRRDLSRAVRIVERERDLFLAAWRKIHE